VSPVPSYPGVYVKEIPSGSKPIEGVGTSTVGFVGQVPGGPVQRVQSFSEFERSFDASTALGDAIGLFFANGGREAWVGGDLAALDNVPELGLLVLPGESDADALDRALAYADARRAFLLVDPPGEDADGAIALVENLRGTGSANAAVYFPPLVTAGKRRSCAPSGAVAAVYARNDPARGVWSSPAGADATIAGVVEPAVALGERDAAKLNDAHVNTIRAFPGRGIIVWGSRTIAAGSSEWKYVSVRRLAIYLERSIDRGLDWAVLEPNDEPAWAKVRAQVGGFLHGLFRAGAFAGRTADEAYFVKCDEATTAQNDLDNGRLIVLVGFAALRPAEFVTVRIEKQLAGPPPGE
jgi:uncharacterized protein